MSNSFRLGPDGVYRCEAFNNFSWQEHGFGTRLRNPCADITLRQIHSDLVVNASGLSDREREGDGLVTGETGTRIGVRTADCVPLLMLDSRTRAVAAIHAGWRGTAAEISTQAVRMLTAEFGSSLEDLYIAIGPCIRPCCYQVGAEVFQRFAPLFPEWDSVPEAGPIDLAEANRRQLLREGVAADRIFDSDLCTACDLNHFFSYRREPAGPGRMVAAICRTA